MASKALVKPPTKQELESLTLAERVALEDVIGEAHDLIRGLNDAEIVRLVEGGASLNSLADLTGLTDRGIAKRLDRLGVQTVGQIEAAKQKGRTGSPPPTPERGQAR